MDCCNNLNGYRVCSVTIGNVNESSLVIHHHPVIKIINHLRVVICRGSVPKSMMVQMHDLSSHNVHSKCLTMEQRVVGILQLS